MPASRSGARLPKPCATNTNITTDAAVKPSGTISTILNSNPAATKNTARQSVAISRSSSGCHPPRSPCTTIATAIAPSPSAVRYGKIRGPTLA